MFIESFWCVTKRLSVVTCLEKSGNLKVLRKMGRVGEYVFTCLWYVTACSVTGTM